MNKCRDCISYMNECIENLFLISNQTPLHNTSTDLKADTNKGFHCTSYLSSLLQLPVQLDRTLTYSMKLGILDIPTARDSRGAQSHT